MQSSTVYTIGTALNRARDHEVMVGVLVAGHWIEGLVSNVDGHGVVLTGPGAEHHVVRIEDISAVRVEGHQRESEPGEPAGPHPSPGPASRPGPVGRSGPEAHTSVRLVQALGG